LSFTKTNRIGGGLWSLRADLYSVQVRPSHRSEGGRAELSGVELSAAAGTEPKRARAKLAGVPTKFGHYRHREVGEASHERVRGNLWGNLEQKRLFGGSAHLHVR
jgi:hypothetical protein